jgi:probable phosphoglycerate mutase
MLDRKPFYFLRHGQTDWNARRIVQGRTDVPLNATGMGQADVAKTLLAGVPVTTICASPLGRALETAKTVNQALQSQLVIIDELQECFFGEAEGELYTGNSYDELIHSAGGYGGEPYEAFAARALAGANKALAHPGPVLIVAHGGIFHALQSHIRLDHNGDMPNAVPVYLEPLDGGDFDWKMERLSARATV